MHIQTSLLRSLVLLFLLVAFAPAQTTPRRALVAINDFQGYGVDSSLVRMITDRFRSEIIKTNYFQIIERGQMEMILQEQSFQQTGCVADSCVVQMGQLLGADDIITGSIGQVKGLWSLSVKLINVETGAIEGAVDDAAQMDMAGVLNNMLPNLALRLVKTQSGELRKALTTVGEGDLYIQSTPAGAQVWLDDEIQNGVTPLALHYIAAGTHEIRLRNGGLGAKAAITLKPNDILKESYSLSDLVADLRVESDPMDAEIWLDGQRLVEHTPTLVRNLTLEGHTLRLEKAGYGRWLDSVSLEYGQITTMHASLPPGFFLSLTSQLYPLELQAISVDSTSTLDWDLAKDTSLSLKAGAWHVSLHAPDQNGLKYYTLDTLLQGKTGEAYSLFYLSTLDSAFVAARHQSRVRMVRWTLLALSAIAGGVTAYYQYEHEQAYDDYKALSQDNENVVFEEAWNKVSDNRHRRHDPGLVTLGILLGFGVTFVF